MKNNRLYFILFILLLASAARAEIYTTGDGYKFEVNLKPQKSAIMLGEPIFIDFEIKNLSDVDLGVLIGGDYQNEFSKPESFNVKAFDSKGKIVPSPKIWTMGGGGMSMFQKSPVGKSYNFRMYLPHWATFEKTGKYEIRVEKGLVVKKYDLNITPDDVRNKGVPVKVNAWVKVVKADYKKMGEIIDAIGAQVVARDDTAERLAPFITDVRIIKYLAEAIKKNSWLLYQLAKFNDDRALNAILSRIDDEADQVRRNVSVSLSRSVNPKAQIYLLQMRNDKSWSIRLDVVHFLGKIKTDESTKILREMLTDEHDWVSRESKRYLLERGEKLN